MVTIGFWFGILILVVFAMAMPAKLGFEEIVEGVRERKLNCIASGLFNLFMVGVVVMIVVTGIMYDR